MKIHSLIVIAFFVSLIPLECSQTCSAAAEEFPPGIQVERVAPFLNQFLISVTKAYSGSTETLTKIVEHHPPVQLHVDQAVESQLNGRFLEAISKPNDVFSLRLHNVRLSADTFRSIARMKSLRLLDIRGEKYDPDNLSFLKEMKSIEDVLLSSNKLRDKHLSHLSDLPLITLYVKSDLITGSGLKSLNCQDTLEFLAIRSKNYQDRSGDAIQKFSKISELDLESCPDAGAITLQSLSSLKTLDILRLSKTKVSTKELRHVLDIQSLRDLYLDHCKNINSESLDLIAQHKTLEMVKLIGVPVSPADIERMEQFNENLVVITKDPLEDVFCE